MNPRPIASCARDQRGATLVELMIALVVLTLGILAVGQLFPAGSRSSTANSLRTSANYYASQKLEQLQGVPWNDASLTAGRHPAAGAESLGTSRQWLRFYQVDVLPIPLDNLKRVVVTVNWTSRGTRAANDTLYLRR